MLRHASVSGRNTLMSDINITPLIDVMLVLLVMFMIASSSGMMPGIVVDLPEIEKKPKILEDSQPLILTISSMGTVYANDKMIKREKLIDELMLLAKNNKETRIFIRGDKNLDYGSVIQIISEISDNGFNKVALITQDQENK